MAFCGNCGTQVVGDFCINCGKPTTLGGTPTESLSGTPNESRTEDHRLLLPPVQEISLGGESTTDSKIDVIPDVTDVAMSEPLLVVENKDKSTSAEKRSRSRNRKARVLIGISLPLIIIVAAFFPVSGNLQVVYMNDSTGKNPATQLTVRTLNQTKDLRSPNSTNQVLISGTWGSFEPISIRVTPRPKADEELSFVPPQIGYLGVWNYGRELTLVIRSTNDRLSVQLEGLLFSIPGNEQSTQRSLFKNNFDACQVRFDNEYGYQINLGSKAFKNYLKFVEDSELDGSRTLRYSTWASRANELENRIGSYISLFKNLAGIPDVTSSNRKKVIDALGDVRSAWRNLEQISRNQAESKWDAAWTRIYNAEEVLSRYTNQFQTHAASASVYYCNSELTRS